ncbi:unnamed protein product [Cuscuta campestris]|uniref:DUF7953 domain-containing protein n=1 Tax=Cuscuta campestris TaxID=132261 RepID=A0A484KEI1_9ASTE|nr:unnamed protein product [Cuscuta campestris]
MATRCRLRSEPSTMLLLYSWILLSWIPEMVSAASVTLESIQIYQTHEPLGSPTLYFLCKGENKTYLPDVKEKDKPYEFKGEEPWQIYTFLLFFLPFLPLLLDLC